MIQFCDIFYFLILPLLVAGGLFFVLMICFRCQNFKGKNKEDTNKMVENSEANLNDRKTNWRNLSPELLSSQIEYHNKAIYKAFEFYVKIMLALLGGISFIALTKSDNTTNVNILIQCGGIITIGVTFLFCVLVIGHQKAKIERWEKRFKCYEIIFWNELWFVSTSIAFASFVYFVVINKIIN